MEETLKKEVENLQQRAQTIVYKDPNVLHLIKPPAGTSKMTLVFTDMVNLHLSPSLFPLLNHLHFFFFFFLGKLDTVVGVESNGDERSATTA